MRVGARLWLDSAEPDGPGLCGPSALAAPEERGRLFLVLVLMLDSRGLAARLLPPTRRQVGAGGRQLHTPTRRLSWGGAPKGLQGVPGPGRPLPATPAAHCLSRQFVRWESFLHASCHWPLSMTCAPGSAYVTQTEACHPGWMVTKCRTSPSVTRAALGSGGRTGKGPTWCCHRRPRRGGAPGEGGWASVTKGSSGAEEGLAAREGPDLRGTGLAGGLRARQRLEARGLSGVGAGSGCPMQEGSAGQGPSAKGTPSCLQLCGLCVRSCG